MLDTSKLPDAQKLNADRKAAEASNLQHQLNIVILDILDAHKRGKCAVKMLKLAHEVQQALKDSGYKVEWYGGTQWDPEPDGGHFTISW